MYSIVLEGGMSSFSSSDEIGITNLLLMVAAAAPAAQITSVLARIWA